MSHSFKNLSKGKRQWRRRWHPLQCSCLENPMGNGTPLHCSCLENPMGNGTHSSAPAWRIPWAMAPHSSAPAWRIPWAMAPHSSAPAWKIPWAMAPTPVLLPGESHGQRSLVGCSPWGCEESDTTERRPFHFSLSCIGEGNGNPLQCSCLENPRDGGAWWAALYGVAQSRTQLK